MTEARRDAPAGRPYVTLNVAMTADGKLAPVDGGKVNFGGAEDRAHMEALRAEADGVLIGGGTLRAEDPPLLVRDEAVRRRRQAAKGSPHPTNIAACTALPDGLAGLRFFNHPETAKLVFTTGKTPPALLEAARRLARVEVVVVPADAEGRVDLLEAAKRLPPLGIRHLLLEGGGELNFSMLRLGLVDEVHLTVCPYIFGGRAAPTPFDGPGFGRDDVRKLALKAHRVGEKGEIFLRYDVLPDPPRVTPSPLFPDGFELG